MSTTESELLRNINEKIELIEPSTGKLFFEHKTELVFVKPRLIPLKSQALESLEEMHRETARQLQQKRTKCINNNKKENAVEVDVVAAAAALAPAIL
ncbi:uncharacterized protein LOC111595713 [Drosophila hydei]|uniref:Uncharacterized protein LOC111595713 n=1 Tax=Drosophila hydei TaxID=7224 RepID=A0A6J1LI24_DROHY|nr:uncharacterized protein LOC111595713 [Drosophila hydei]